MSSVEMADVASGQWGLITTAQAKRVGVTAQAVARLAREGALDRLAHGIYRIAGTPPDPRDGVRAAWLGLDPDQFGPERVAEARPDLVSHRSAAMLLGIGDLIADEHEFTVLGRRQSRREDIRFHRDSAGATEWTVEDGLPVTTAVQTIHDLAAGPMDGDHLRDLVRDAITSGKASPDDLAVALRASAHRFGVALGDASTLIREATANAALGTEIQRTWLHAAAAQSEATRPAIEAAQAAALAHSERMRPVLEAARAAAITHDERMRPIAETARQAAVAQAAALQPAIEAARQAAESQLRQAFSPEALRELARIAVAAADAAEAEHGR
jgi:hypothetical protein